MDYLLQVAAAGALLAVFYMYEYWFVTLGVAFLVAVVVIATQSGRNSSR